MNDIKRKERRGDEKKRNKQSQIKKIEIEK